MFNPNANVSPVNPIPKVIVILALAIALAEVILQLASAGFIGGPEGVGWRVSAMRNVGFFDGVFEFMRQTGTYDLNTLGRFIGYIFVHYSFTHAAFAVVMILAIGKFVAESFRTVSVIILVVACAVSGALVYGLYVDSNQPLIGAYPVVYGLLGAYTWILWLTAGATGQNRLTAFKLIGFLLLLQLTFRMIIPLLYDHDVDLGSDWIADLTGFIVGFSLSFVLAPDGRARIGRMIQTVRKR